MGTTALYDAIIDALIRLKGSAREKKVLIVISDGGDNASKAPLDRVLKMAEQSSAMIYTIGIFEPEDPGREGPESYVAWLMKPAARRSFPRGSLKRWIFASALPRTFGINTQSDTRRRAKNGDGRYHKIGVTARSTKGGKLSVRTRAGYSAADAPPAISGW